MFGSSLTSRLAAFKEQSTAADYISPYRRQSACFHGILFNWYGLEAHGPTLTFNFKAFRGKYNAANGLDEPMGARWRPLSLRVQTRMMGH